MEQNSYLVGRYARPALKKKYLGALYLIRSHDIEVECTNLCPSNNNAHTGEKYRTL